MATGILGTPSDLIATAYTTVYTVPPSTFAVLTLSMVNRGATACTIRVGISTSSTPAAGEFIEYDAELLASGVLERTGIVLEANKRLIVYSSANNVSAVAYGIETSTA